MNKEVKIKFNITKNYIDVIGIDRLRHIAEPHLDVCRCGVKILYKYIPKNSKYFSCYECIF